MQARYFLQLRRVLSKANKNQVIGNQNKMKQLKETCYDID